MTFTRARCLRSPLVLLPSCGGGIGHSHAPDRSRRGCATEAVANEGWLHVNEGSAITYRQNPPASGMHYPVWARYEEHRSRSRAGTGCTTSSDGGIVSV